MSILLFAFEEEIFKGSYSTILEIEVSIYTFSAVD